MNVATFLQASARQQPQQVAWRYGEEHATYEEVVDRVARLAGALKDAGLRRGDRVALALPNRPELLETLFACWWGGFVAVPINWHLHPREIACILDDCTARAVLVSGETREAVRSQAPYRSDRILIDVDPGATEQTAWHHLAATPRSVAIAAVDPREIAWIFYTSGTTGRPKGAMLSHRSLVNLSLNFFADIDSVQPGSVFLHAAPLTHGSGLYMLPAVAHAATNVISTSLSFDPEDYLALIDSHRVTHGAFVASTMLKRIVEARKVRRDFDLTSLKLIVAGGGPIYEADLRTAVRVLGPIVVQMYGQGESPMTIAVMSASTLEDAIHDGPGSRLLSCGRPFSGVAVKVVTANGCEAINGEDGEIWVRGDVVMSGYWNNDRATHEALEDGWLRTGDVGHFDNEGFLYLTDRAKDVIITGGTNVYPREIEEILIRHKAVREAAVIGVPDPDWGEAVTAYVVLREGCDATAAELIDFTRSHVASFKKPKHVLLVDELPRNPTGKILRRALRERNPSLVKRATGA